MTEIPTAECNALTALYISTNGTNWITKTNWLETNTPCSWYGMTCSAGHGTYRVVIYAVDDDGLQARPRELTVTVGERVYLPLIVK